MQILKTIFDLRKSVSTWKSLNETIALIPTMGALHRGHLSLIELGNKVCRRTILTIFLNPTQFGDNEDLDLYPSNLQRDVDFVNDKTVDALYIPDTEEMYPKGFATNVIVSDITTEMCGARRPGHFKGVATVVTKLLIQAQPNKAIFGEKDYQQLQVIKKLTRDLNIPVGIVAAPTIRESDGLALSSRNSYLSPNEKKVAPALYETLKIAAAKIVSEPKNVKEICEKSRRKLITSGFDSVEYFDLRHEDNLELIPVWNGNARLLAAAKLGRARLIDNIRV